MAHVVVVGAGHAAVGFVALLRQGGHLGRITLLSDEVDYPYHRPPLSKKFGNGEVHQWLRPATFYSDQDVTIRLSHPVAAVDVDTRCITTAAGESLRYDVLVLATGARPRRLALPGADLDGVGTLRELGDARVLRKWLDEGRRVVIVGGGYIGLEVAAVVATAGHAVTVLEREPRLLARVASAPLSAIVHRTHVSAGTEIRTEADVVSIDGSSGRVGAVALADGTGIACDAVLVGVGAVPNDDLAQAAGIVCAGGIVVDDGARTSADGVLAIGDATVRPVLGANGSGRLESIPSATEQARQATATILGLDRPAPEVPWFWSDQFDLRLKIAGIVRPGLQAVLRGDPESGRFAVFHLDRGVPVAVESSNAAPEFTAARKWIHGGTALSPDRLADSSVSLRDVAFASNG
jgi:3-phenylpropionate/trans-cinnamate dioxygenase ferredoxin reductase subunit